MRAVIFDLDGVLVDSEHLNKKAFCECLAELGRADGEDLFALTLGRRDSDCLAEVAARLGLSPVDLSSRLAAKTARYRAQIAPMPGAREAVRALRAAGYRLAVATSSEPDLGRELLDRVAPPEFFDVVLTADDVVAGKPNPAIYLLAAERLGVKPGECVVVEDSPVGVTAAVAAGVHCIALIGSVDASNLAQAPAHALSMHRVLALIRQL